MESEEAGNEEATYSNIAETRVTFNGADANDDGGTKVAMLYGAQQTGPALSLQVNTGDELKMKAYAYYEGGEGYSNTGLVETFIASVAGAFGGINGGIEAQQATYDVFDNAMGQIGLQGTSNDNRPAAYLNYILFDENMVLAQHGHVQITTAANGNHEEISLNGIVAEKPGYAYIYVSNESVAGNPVYFDDIEVTLVENEVVQRDDYYPFGLTFNSYQRVTAEPNNFKFHNGTELIKDLDLNWYHFKYRMHDPAIGRFFVVDPLAEEYVYNSPYAFAENKLGRGIELEGLELGPFPWAFFARPAPALVRPVSVPRVTPRVVPRFAPRNSGTNSSLKTNPLRQGRIVPRDISRQGSRGGDGAGKNFTERTKSQDFQEKFGNSKEGVCRDCGNTIRRGVKNEKGQPRSTDQAQGDHIAPKNPRPGGGPAGNNTKDNLQWLCPGCNGTKTNISPEQFYQVTAPADATQLVQPINPQQAEDKQQQQQQQQQQQDFSDCVSRGDCI